MGNFIEVGKITLPNMARILETCEMSREVTGTCGRVSFSWISLKWCSEYEEAISVDEEAKWANEDANSANEDDKRWG